MQVHLSQREHFPTRQIPWFCPFHFSPQKEQKDLKKLQKLVNPLELAMTHPEVSHEDHVTQLHQAYEQLEGEYMKVIEKLAGTIHES